MIKLKVPEKTETESVSIGNFSADLKPGGKVETESRQFADWLINQHGLIEESVEPSQPEPEKTDAEKLLEEYPPDFPHRKRFANAGLPHQTVIGLDRDGLIAVNGIGGTYADEVLEYLSKPPQSENSEEGGEE